MWATFLIALREGLEAALIVGILLTVLHRLGQRRWSGMVWAGVGVAVLLSLLAGVLLNTVGVALEGPAEEIFEGATMLLAAGVLTWMIFWMQRQGRELQAGLEGDVRRALARDSAPGLFLLALTAVLREGVETALFLTASSFGASTLQVWAGTLLGFAVAVALGLLVFAGGRRLDIRLFFRVTGVLLLLFAAGLVGRGVHELQEAGVLPVVLEHLWDINGILDEKGAVGTFLTALLGYNGNPSLLEVAAYGIYMVVLVVLQRRMGRRWGRRPQPVADPASCAG